MPLRKQIRSRVVPLSKSGYSRKRILAEIDERTSEKLIGDAIALDEQLKLADLASPLLFQSEPAAHGNKMKLHRNPRDSFEPVPGFVRPEI